MVAVASVAMVNFAISLLLSASLNSLWGMVHSLEIVAAFNLLALRLPMNASTLYQICFEVANFDLLPIYIFTDEIDKEVEEYDTLEEGRDKLDATAN